MDEYMIEIAVPIHAFIKVTSVMRREYHHTLLCNSRIEIMHGVMDYMVSYETNGPFYLVN